MGKTGHIFAGIGKVRVSEELLLEMLAAPEGTRIKGASFSPSPDPDVMGGVVELWLSHPDLPAGDTKWKPQLTLTGERPRDSVKFDWNLPTVN